MQPVFTAHCEEDFTVADLSTSSNKGSISSNILANGHKNPRISSKDNIEGKNVEGHACNDSCQNKQCSDEQCSGED